MLRLAQTSIRARRICQIFCIKAWRSARCAALTHCSARAAPWPMYKHYSHEGGISSPLIAHWPARIKTGGQWRAQYGLVIDVMATLVDVAGAQCATVNGNWWLNEAASGSFMTSRLIARN